VKSKRRFLLSQRKNEDKKEESDGKRVKLSDQLKRRKLPPVLKKKGREGGRKGGETQIPLEKKKQGAVWWERDLKGEENRGWGGGEIAHDRPWASSKGERSSKGVCG